MIYRSVNFTNFVQAIKVLDTATNFIVILSDLDREVYLSLSMKHFLTWHLSNITVGFSDTNCMPMNNGV